MCYNVLSVGDDAIMCAFPILSAVSGTSPSALPKSCGDPFTYRRPSQDTVHGPRPCANSPARLELSAVSGRLSTDLSPLECAVPRFRTVTPLECAVTKGNYPLWTSRGELEYKGRRRGRVMTPERDVAQIIRLLHPSDSVWRTTFVMKGFLDDSGTHDGSLVLGIGGCVAREEQWNFFATDWQQMLEDFGIEEFKSSDLQVFAGEFKGWTEDKRRSLIGTAAKIGTKWAKDSFASLVVRSDYADAVPEWAKNTPAFGGDYNFCFQMTVGRIMAWINRLHVPMPANEQIAFVFDQQPKKEGISRNNYAAIKSF